MSTSPGTLNMELTRTIDASVENVWRAWSDSALVKQWWGPRVFTCPVANMDFREGGTSLVCMRAPAEFGGMDMYNTWHYTKIVSHERIEFTQHFSDANGNQIEPTTIGLPPDIPSAVPHVITFKPTGQNKTELSITEFGYSNPDTVAMSKSGMAECIDKMQAIFA